MDLSNEGSGPSKSPRRWWRWLLIPVAILLVTPWVLAKTTLRDQLINAIVNSDDIRVESRDASFGYIRPLSLTGLRVESSDRSALIEVEQIAADRSWLSLLFSRPDLGTFRFDEPRFDITVKPKPEQESATQEPTDAEEPVDATTPQEPSEPPQLPMLTVEIRDAAVVVRTPESAEPPIDLENINATFRLEREQDRSVLRGDPVTIFDHQELTPQLCGQGLQLVAPLLADELSAEGAFSLHLAELQVPLVPTDDPAKLDVRIAGEIELHSASVALKNTAAKTVLDVLARILGDGLPEKLTVAEGVKVKFQVADGRVRHEGLAFLLPHRESSIEIVSSGSVGLDETLDLEVSIQLPEDALGESRLATTLTGEPIVVAVTGTFEKPEVGLGGEESWIHSITDLIAGDEDDPSDDQLSESLMDIVGGMLDRVPERRPRSPREPRVEREPPAEAEPVFPRLRERLQGRRGLLGGRRNDGAADPTPPADDNPPTGDEAPTPL